MSTVKTAISLDKSLFQKIDALARRMGVPRSRVFVLAAEKLIREDENRELLEQINRAYTGEPDPEEQARRAAMKAKQRRLVDGEW